MGTESAVTDPDLAKRARLVALIIAGTMVFWMVGQFLGGRLGLPGNYAFAIDVVALVVLVWSMFATNRIRRHRRGAQNG